MIYLPNSTSFISGFEQRGFPSAGLVLRGCHDYLEGRQPRNTTTDDADVHGAPLDDSLIRPCVNTRIFRVNARQ